jgi:uncharacterized protein YndB with AHSA1/START domain
MALETIEVSTVLPAPAERIYKAWLDAVEHSAFTGGQATVDPTVGGRHTAWDGYIEGVNVELVPGARIVQTWRSEDFPEEAGDSRLEVRLDVTSEGTRVTIRHSDIPEGQGEEYRRGWIDHYFTPMAKYFAGGGAAAAARPSEASIWEAAAGGEPDGDDESAAPKPKHPISSPVIDDMGWTTPGPGPGDADDDELTPVPVLKPAAKPKAKAKAKAKPTAKAKPAAKPKAKAKPKAAAKPKAKAKAKAKPKAAAKPKAKAKAKAKPAKKSPAKKKR